MTDLSEIQARFDAALALIEGAAQSGSDAQEVAGLKSELSEAQALAASAKEEAAKASAAQKAAEAKVAELEAEANETADASEADEEAMAKQIEALEKARAASAAKEAKTKQFNKQLKKLNASLRAANEKNVGDPASINESMKAELAALKAEHAADLEEVNGILARLTPLVEGA